VPVNDGFTPYGCFPTKPVTPVWRQAAAVTAAQSDDHDVEIALLVS